MKKVIFYAVLWFIFIHLGDALAALDAPVREALLARGMCFCGLPEELWVRILWTPAQSAVLIAGCFAAAGGIRAWFKLLEAQKEKAP